MHDSTTGGAHPSFGPTGIGHALIMVSQRHRFESQTSVQTLTEGLAEYFASNPTLKRGEKLSPEAREFFHAHDTVHVLYGCRTTMLDEAIVKLSSLFGTTGGFGMLRGYLLHDTLDIYRTFPLGSTLLALVAAPYLIVRTIWRCSRQSEPWPWSENGQFMPMQLAAIRSHFGIKVAHVSKPHAA